MFTKRFFLILSILIFALGTAFGIYKYFFAKVTLRVAIENSDDTEAQILSQLSQRMEQDRKRFKFQLIPYGSKQNIQTALRERKAHLAVLRADDLQPRSYASIAVIMHLRAVFALPKNSPIKDWKDFSNKTVGITGRFLIKEDPLIATQLRLLGARNVKFIHITPEQAIEQIAKKQIHAVSFISPTFHESEALRKINAEMRFLDIEDAETALSNEKRYEESTIPAASLLPKPVYPPEQISTFEVKKHLIALRIFPNRFISSLLNDLYDAKRALLNETQIVSHVDAPDTEPDAHVKVHQGASAFYNQEEESLTQYFLDNFYVFTMILGGLGTALVWLFHRIAPKDFFNGNSYFLSIETLNEKLATATKLERKELYLEAKNMRDAIITHIKKNDCSYEEASPLLEKIDELITNK